MKKHQNTGIFNEFTKETQEINEQLFSLYAEWHKHIESFLNNEEYKKYNGLHLLTCFDPYQKSKNKIMLFGKEANTNEGTIDVFDSTYQTDEYYNYEYLIANPNKAAGEGRKQIRNTPFLKTRKILSGFSAGEKPTYEKLLSVIINNLNKTSFNGNFTPCNYDFDNHDNKMNIENNIYRKFEFNGVYNNIYIHELNILRPTHIIFLCGKGYNKHIKRDFGQSFFNENEEAINQLSAKDHPTSKAILLDEQRILRHFGLEQYESLKVIFALHPNAYMTAQTRCLYEETLSSFIK